MKTILLFLPEGFEILEASALSMSWAEPSRRRWTTQLVSCGYSKQIKSSFGQQFIADKTIEQINAATIRPLPYQEGLKNMVITSRSMTKEISAYP